MFHTKQFFGFSLNFFPDIKFSRFVPGKRSFMKHFSLSTRFDTASKKKCQIEQHFPFHTIVNSL